ncbi:MAG: hypothetical protein HRT74_05720 [Flavobacteriales bacterium]|nr:hypothetical protein [Flavobacteriales bacterium]
MMQYSLDAILDIAQNDKKAVKNFNRIFIEQTINVDLPSLKQYTEDENWSEAFQMAHKMKPSIILYKIENSLKAIKELEQIKNNSKVNRDEVKRLVNILEIELTLIKEQLQA